MAVIVSNISGTISDGESISITGSGFGVGPSNVEWLGGAGGNIESGTPGNSFSKTDWAVDGSFNIPKYSSAQYHSGSKSIYCNPVADGDYNSIFKYGLPVPVSSTGKLFLSFWVRMSPSAGKGWNQWKINRFSALDTIKDGLNQLVLSSWDDGEKGTQLCVDPNVVSYTSVSVEPVYTTDTWQRIDIWIEAGATNGSFTITQYISGVSKRIDTVSPYPTHRSGSAWNYIIWQNYLGNGSSGEADIFYDDIYISNGSQARVEIGNAATYSACTHMEIQPSTSWASGAITATLNRGSFGSTDSVYLYIIAADGSVNSSGYLITFGDEGADTTPDPFTFTDVTGATRATEYTSNQVTITGLGDEAVVSISGGYYNKNGGTYTSEVGTCVAGDIFTVRPVSSPYYSSATSAVLTIGGVSDTYSVTTGAAPSAPSGGGTGLNAKPKILCDNLLEDGTLACAETYSSTYSLANLIDKRPYTYWVGADSTSAFVIDCDLPAVAQFNMIGITRHNLFSAGATLTFSVSADGDSYVPVMAYTPTDNKTIMLEAPAVIETQYLRMTITTPGTVQPFMAILYLGLGITFERYAESFDPYNETPQITASTSEAGGNLLGLIYNHTQQTFKVPFKLVSNTWAVGTFKPAWDAHIKYSYPFFFGWDITNHGSEVYFVRWKPGATLAMPYDPVRHSLTLEMEGVVEDNDASFAIEEPEEEPS